MNNKIVIGALAAVLVMSAACGSTNTNANKTATAASPAAAASPTPAAAANPATDATTGAQDFTLINATGVEIDKVYISPSGSDDWEEDILGQDTLPNDQKVDIKFNRNEKSALWDLRIEDKEGNPIEWEKLNLLEISKITLHYKDGKATAETE